jgi:hypothetical protein
MSRKKRGFIIPVLIVFILLALGTAGYFAYVFLSSPDPDEDHAVQPNGTLSVKPFESGSGEKIDDFFNSLADRFNLIKEKVISAPVLSEISIEKDGEYYPASAWVASLLYKGKYIDDFPGGIPYTRIEITELPGLYGGKAAKPFPLRWGDEYFTFIEHPQSIKSIVSYQKNVGAVPLLVTFIWPAPALTEVGAWVESLKGFDILVSRDGDGVGTESGVAMQEVSEYFLHNDKGGKALLKVRDGNVVYADVTITSDAFEKLQNMIKSGDIPNLPGQLPESFVLGDWTWRERGGIRPDFIKGVVTDGMASMFSLYQWTNDRKQNTHLVYGLARTWNGFLSDLSFWFERDGWEKVKNDVFKWFGMEGFNFTEMNEPIYKNGLEMFLVNVDEKIIVVNIRDTKIAELASIFYDGWGDNLVLEIRDDYIWKMAQSEKQEEGKKKAEEEKNNAASGKKSPPKKK